MFALRLTAILVAVSLGTPGQGLKRPQFDVASIHLSKMQRRVVLTLPGGRLSATASLRLLVEYAFRVAPFQIIGGPDWAKSDRYDVEAKAEGNPSKEQLFLMLQSLLEDRFRLRTHRETRELPVYELVPTRNGPKLPFPKASNCVSPDAPSPPAPGGPSNFFQCGRVLSGGGAAGGIVKGGSVAMAEFARVLSIVMGRPVIDKTGFTRTFDVQLVFALDSATTMGSPDSGDAPSPDRPSIFVALQEQLGLKLEPSKGPVELLVIDHAERPSSN